MDKKSQKITNLQEEFNKIQEDNKDFDASKLLANLEDIPNLGEIDIYDYQKDIEAVEERAIDMMNSLVDLYLGDLPQAAEHPYIKNKVKEDADDYADALFLKKMTKKTLISQLRAIDNGTNGARDYEVINQTMGQMRENQKYSNDVKTKLEDYYKKLKSDLPLTKVANTVIEDRKEESEKANGGMIIDPRTLNEMIARATMKDEKK